MRYLRLRLMLAGTLALAAPVAARAQAAPRWTAWLGCWAPDSGSALGGTAATSLMCVVPVANSSSVDALTIVRGAIASRDRLTTTLKPHVIDGQGCRGVESERWSATGRRAYLNSTYTCTGGSKGSSESIYAFTPRGEWLRVTEVRSGDGSIVSAERLHEVPAPESVPASALRAIDREQLAITTARAAAAAKITVPEVMDALNAVDSGVVRSWILASDQRFYISTDEATTLAHGNLPVSVMQAMLGGREAAAANGADNDVDVYLSTPTYVPQTALYACPPGGCYAPTTTNVYVPAPMYPSTYPTTYPYSVYPYGYPVPVIIHRGGERRGEPFHRGAEPRRPVEPVPSRPRGPSGVRP